MGHFTIHSTSLTGLLVVERQRIGDDRGWFSRFFCSEELCIFGKGRSISQINHTLTRIPGTVRGMHFQRKPHGERKLVSCLRGEVLDVAVDLRADSPSFGSWHGELLSEENGRSLLIPQGFAHGFQTLRADCELLYLHDVPYAPTFEGGVNALDPALAISWPLPVSLMSSRDRALPHLSQIKPL